MKKYAWLVGVIFLLSLLGCQSASQNEKINSEISSIPKDLVLKLEEMPIGYSLYSEGELPYNGDLQVAQELKPGYIITYNYGEDGKGLPETTLQEYVRIYSLEDAKKQWETDVNDVHNEITNSRENSKTSLFNAPKLGDASIAYLSELDMPTIGMHIQRYHIFYRENNVLVEVIVEGNGQLPEKAVEFAEKSSKKIK